MRIMQCGRKALCRAGATETKRQILPNTRIKHRLRYGPVYSVIFVVTYSSHKEAPGGRPARQLCRLSATGHFFLLPGSRRQDRFLPE